VQDSINLMSAKKLPLFNTSARLHWPQNLPDISSERTQVVEYVLLSPWSATLFKTRILYYKLYHKYIYYIYIFTHGCRQTLERSELKEPLPLQGLMLPLGPLFLGRNSQGLSNTQQSI